MLRKLMRRLVRREKASSASYVAFLRKRGARIGENVRFFDPVHCHVDQTAPWLIRIGDHVSITRGVVLLTHDYSWSVLKRQEEGRGEILGAQGPLTIGSNVFIGMNAIITRGVTIGDDVIIGAGSVVTRDCESGWVYAGNPAKKLMTLEDFREKRRQAQFQEAKVLAHAYWDRFGTMPPPAVFSEYFQLFCKEEEALQEPAFRRQMETGADFSGTLAFLKGHEPLFSGFDAFLDACFSGEGAK